MSIKMELTTPEILEIKTPYGTVLVSFLDQVGLSVNTYTDPESNSVSGVHIKSDGEIVEIHCPNDPWAEA